MLKFRHCLADDVIPTFMTCHMSIEDDYGEIAQSTHDPTKSSECKNQLDFYGKYQVHKTETTMEVDADISNLTHPVTSEDFHYGITDAKVQMIKKPLAGRKLFRDLELFLVSHQQGSVFLNVFTIINISNSNFRVLN